jgi:putative restriction endonuclease
MNPNGPTLLLGWYPDLSIFAGFDITRHQNFLPGSNSVQISLTALRSASNFGWGFYTNQFGEISAAFRSTELMNYVRNQELIHRSGALAANLLIRAARLEQIEPADLAPLPGPRRKIVQTITRLARAANFTDQVLAAYNNRCAVTGAQLKLVDAAHILPVVAPNSVDHVTNGICLSPTYHRAFDNGLIYLSADYHMRLNRHLVNRLRNTNLIAGLNEFSHYLDREVFLPANPDQRPNVAFIRRANLFRKIPNG